jgi:glycosyltransferase involved in cell wall biosynthesis
VEEILRHGEDIEVCVHVDGSDDGSYESLAAIGHSRLRISVSDNRGRANALLTAVGNSTGRFVMLFDDDDELSAEGVSQILDDCGAADDRGVVGYIYHMCDESGHIIGSEFPVGKSNFLALRADHRVAGDKKEVVLGALLRREMSCGRMQHRRVPTSVYWCRIALAGDVLCRETVVGRKRYLETGMSAGIAALKRSNASPMAELYLTHIRGYLRGRYRSVPFLARAIAGAIFYSGLGWLPLTGSSGARR